MVCFVTQGVLANNTIYTSIEVNANIFQTTISGTVTDDSGSPLPGASVVEKGTTNGTQTDFDGNYTIEVDTDVTLVISYIGFATQEVAVNGNSEVNVTLQEDAAALDEVIVTGYGTQTRGDITGSVATVDVSEATKAPIVNAAEALQGRVSGVSVVSNGDVGSAPKITIRGFGSSNNTDPLYIIDGVQTENADFLNGISPNDIDQINVLKDGAAAIYGARASNGVVIITTKSGSYNMSKPVISVDTYTGFSQAVNVPKLLNAQQHGDMLYQSFTNDGVAFNHVQYGSGSSAVVPATLQNYTRVESYDPIVRAARTATVKPGGTDWLDAILRTASTQSASISLQNGSDTGRYYLSASYLDREGVQLHTGFKQAVTRLNSEFRLSDKITIGEHLSVTYSNGNTPNFLVDAQRMNPLIPVYDDEGDFAGSLTSANTGNVNSPAAQLFRSRNDYNKNLNIIGDVYASAELLDGLTIKTNLSATANVYNQRIFQSLDPEHGEPQATNKLTELDEIRYAWTWTNTLNYIKSFDKHSLNALVGIEAVKNTGRGKQVNVNGYLFETPDYYLLNNGSGTPSFNDAFDTSSSLYSIFGTAAYNYDGKYFLTATVRNDKSSRFLGDNQSQTFPSVSAGWLASNEDFFPQDGIISRLKLKGSYGELGNQTLPADNPTINISVLSESQSNYAINGSSIATGAFLQDIGNPNLKWETSVATNAGIELGLFNNNLNLEFEYFNIETKDLVNRDLSLISSTAIDANAPLVNLGTVVNKGFDFSLSFDNETESGFSYGISANISKYKNEVIELISDFQLGDSFTTSGIVTRTEVGRPISSFYGLNQTGYDNTGRFTFADIDNSGDITDADRTFIGSPHPDFTYGINLSTGYKGFDISAFLQGSQGNDIYNQNKIFTDFPSFVNGNRSVRVLDSWTPTNTNPSLPALSATIQGNEANSNSFFVEDGSYMRLKNLQIGYTIPNDVLGKYGIDSFRIYVQGSNLFTLTGYDGWDPEIISFDNLTLGVDNGISPQPRIMTLGLNIKL
ncbi:TonB-dependent receptor [Aurantibacter crassamenti]|nr:TonB-dependent receptor [Aurantibacter crassamenti]